MQLNKQLLERGIGHEADEEAKRHGDNTESKGYAPLTSTNAGHLEGSPTDENDQNLDADLCEIKLHKQQMRKIERGKPISVIPMK